MAVNLAPTAIFPTWACDGTTISFKRTDLFELTASACHPVTGDARALILALLKTANDAYLALEERPVAVALRYDPGSFVTNDRDVFYENVKAIFRQTYYINFPEETIAAEPS